MFTARILGACNIFQSEHLQVLWLGSLWGRLEEIKRKEERRGAGKKIIKQRLGDIRRREGGRKERGRVTKRREDK